MTDPDTNATVMSTTLSTAQSLKITWTIPDYLSLPDSSDCSMDSPSFNFANATWRFRIYTKNLCDTIVSLVRLNSSLSYHKIICRYGIMDKKDYDFGDYYRISYDENGESRDFCFSDLESQLLSELNENAADGEVTLTWHLLSEALYVEDAFSQKGSDRLDSGKRYEVDESQNSSTLFLESSKARSLKIMWKISDYFNLPNMSFDYTLSSPPFSFADTTCCYRLYPNGTGENDLNTKISLVKIDSLLPRPETTAVCNIKVENAENLDDYYKKCPLMANHGCDFLVPAMSDLHKQRCNIAPYGRVTVLGHFFYEESLEVDLNVCKVKSEFDTCKTLCQDLQNLLLKGQDADLTLKVNDKEFRVHRSILRARSQVLESLLTHDVIEENSGVVDIPDCDPQAMEQFLLYVYCGQVDAINENNMLGLYSMSDKYKMMSLREECCDFIKNSLSNSNISDVMQLALCHNDESLLELATNFFVNHTSEILTTAEWLAFLKENEVAANELFITATMKWCEAKTN